MKVVYVFIATEVHFRFEHNCRATVKAPATPNYKHSFNLMKNYTLGAGKMAQQLAALRGLGS